MESFDVLVVGGGIAGVSIACELAAERRVALIEMESALAYHTTGRSAAMFLESYGGPAIRALTTASRDFLTEPAWTFDRPLLKPLAMLHTAGPGRSAAIHELYAQVKVLVPDVELIEADDVASRQPLLRPGHVELALLEPRAMEIDVNALHEGFRREFARRGGQVARSAAAQHAERRNREWIVTDTRGQQWRVPVVVNAAGAWADQVGQIFGARALPLAVLRRSVFMIDAPADIDLSRLPMIADIDDNFYLKPEGAQLLCSPADETLQAPSDARPDEVEIARAIEAIEAATILDQITHVRSTWAGLRTFAPDRTPVVGYDPDVAGLFWFAGQGGYGIQTAPALARTGAALLGKQPVPADIATRGLRADALAVERLRAG